MAMWNGFIHGAQEGREGFRSGLIQTATGLLPEWRRDGFRKAARGLAGGLKQSGRSAWEMSFKGALLFNMPIAAFSAASAPRGRALSAGTSGLSMGFGSMVGGLLGGTAGALAGGFLADSFIGEGVGSAVQFLKDYDRNSRRMHFGGEYADTEATYTMRQTATRELAGSLMNARQWLGKEGAFLHV